MRENRVKEVKKAFLKIYHAIQDLTDDDILNSPAEPFTSHFECLQELIATDVDDQCIHSLLLDNEFVRIAGHIARLKTTNGLRMEIGYARSVAAAGTDPWALVEAFPYYRNYQELAKMEYRGARLKPKDTVVFLGSGPMPLSLVCLFTQFQIKGVGIEKQKDYADLSRQVIKSLDLDAHIRIVQGDHYSLPFESSLVMVGADAVPKEEIFGYLVKNLPMGAKITYRIYEKGLRKFMERLSPFKLPAGLMEYDRIRPEPPVNNTCVFLVKK